MPQLYAFQPDGHGPKSFFVIAESLEDALVRVTAYAKADYPYSADYYDGLELPYRQLKAGVFTNGSYDLTILNPGEVIDNDND